MCNPSRRAGDRCQIHFERAFRVFLTSLILSVVFGVAVMDHKTICQNPVAAHVLHTGQAQWMAARNHRPLVIRVSLLQQFKLAHSMFYCAPFVSRAGSQQPHRGREKLVYFHLSPIYVLPVWGRFWPIYSHFFFWLNTLFLLLFLGRVPWLVVDLKLSARAFVGRFIFLVTLLQKVESKPRVSHAGGRRAHIHTHVHTCGKIKIPEWKFLSL